MQSGVGRTTASPRLVRVLRVVALLAGAMVVAIGAAVMVGWAVEARWLIAPLSRSVQVFLPMVPNTALMLVLSGLSLGLSVIPRLRRVAKGFALACSAAALATLLQDILARDFGIDAFLFNARPSRPAVLTLVAILLSDGAILLLDVHWHRGPTPSELLGVAATTVAWLAIAGYLLGAVPSYAWSRHPQTREVAIHTSVALLALGFGVIVVRPESGAMAVFTSSHAAGRVARRMLAIILAIPAAGLLAGWAQGAGWYRPPGATIVEVAAGVVVALGTTYAVTASLERSEARRRQLEDESQEWKRFFNRATFGAVVGSGDERLGVVNEAFARMHGTTVAEHTGQPIAELFVPQRRAELADQIRLARKCGNARWDSEHFRKDGSVFPVRIDVSAIRGERDQVLGFAAYVQDIAREKAAEEAQARLASLVRSADDAIVATSVDGTILDWNHGAEQVFGYSAAEAVGRSIVIVVPADRRAERDGLQAKVMAGENVVGFETERVRKDGTRFPLALTLSPIRDASDRIIGVSTIERDISVLKEFQREREEWTSVVAHDLRQPSTTIRLTIEMLERAPDERVVQRGVQRLRRASDRLERMIGDLLDVTRIEARRLSIKRGPASLPHLIDEATELVPEAASRCRKEVAANAVSASVDGERFIQVMMNLLSNAVKYGYPETPIAVAVEPADSMVQVTVTNEGAGIASDEIPRLFSRFARTRSAQHSDAPGLGLGLYMCRGIVEAHGGQLWVESTPGEKTHVRFTLPKTRAGGDRAA
jgi:PAS domain S-box-containing protein